MKKSFLAPPNFTPTMGAYSHGIFENIQAILREGGASLDRDALSR